MFKMFLGILIWIVLVFPAWGSESFINNKKDIIQKTGKIVMLKKQNSNPVIVVSFKNGDTKEYVCDRIKIFKLAFNGDLIKKRPLTCRSLKKGMLVKTVAIDHEIIFYVNEIDENY